MNSHTLQRLYRHEDGFPSLDTLPLPNWDLYREKRYLPVHFVETTRGCPLDCEFCAVTTAFGGRYRNRPHDEVIAELRSLRPFDGRFTLKNCVFFVDDNIISNRADARELLSRLGEFKLKWFSHASMNIAKDPEMLELCQKSGCVGLFIGFETLSAETLRTLGKRVNHPEEYLEVVRRIHDHGIGIDASFVFGLDGDDEGVFDRTLEFVERAKLEVAYYSILTPYPGTRLHQRLTEEKRIISQDWSLYDTSHVVYRPRQLTPDQLLDGYARARQGVLFPQIDLRAAVGHNRLQAVLLPDELWVPAEFARHVAGLSGRAHGVACGRGVAKLSHAVSAQHSRCATAAARGH